MNVLFAIFLFFANKITNGLAVSPNLLLHQLESSTQLKKSSHYFVEAASSHSYRHYQQGKRVDPSSLHTVIFVTKQKNIQVLRQILLDVSDPSHPKYGKFLTGDQVAELTSNPYAVKHIESFLRLYDLNIISRSPNNEYITVEGSVRTWEDILHTKFYEFELKDSNSHGIKLIRSLEYSLPTKLKGHVASVFNTIHFPNIGEIVKSLPDSFHTTAIKSGFVTPQVINKAYDVRSNKGNSLASQAVYESLDQSFSPSDLSFFQTFFHLPLQSVSTDIGGHQNNRACDKNNGADCAEANLDVQYLMAMAQAIPTTYYYWGGKDFMTAWLLKVAAMASPPLVFSISYGMDELALAASYFEAFDIQAMKLGVRGVTLLAAAGDDGAVTPDARKSFIHCRYSPQFPASSPYVTAVGGTMGPESGKKEVVCQSDRGGSITGGGGFSLAYPTPDWQKKEVLTYLQTVKGTSQDPPKGYHAEGRGYPDVSLLAHNYVVAIRSNLSAVSGTSASSPVFAGMVSLVNAARLARGGSPLGWINPSLYKYKDKFSMDIVDGNNNCVASGTVCCSQGFHATTGWDPASGLGSVNFTAFLDVFLGIESHPNSPSMTPSPLPGYPTPPPVTSPSSLPTPVATSSPTSSPGWLLMKEYSSLECNGTITSASLFPTGSCLVVYDADNSPVGSEKYYCQDDIVIGESFSDSSCSEASISNVDYFGRGCAGKVVDYYYSDNLYSADLECVPSYDLPSLLPNNPNKFAVQKSFDDPAGCTDASKISRINAFLQNYCFDSPHESLSYHIAFPNMYLYQGTGCSSSSPQTQAINTDCAVVASNSYGEYYSGSYQYYPAGLSLLSTVGRGSGSDNKGLNYYYGSGSYGSSELNEIWEEVVGTSSSLPVPSKAPVTKAPSYTSSLLPSRSPTVANTPSPTSIYYSNTPSLFPSTSLPSSNAPVVKTEVSNAPSFLTNYINSYGKFTVVQVLKGVTSSQINSNSDVNGIVLKRAIVDLLTGITLSNIAITSVKDLPYMHYHLQTIGCAVNYSITFNSIDVGFSDASAAYHSFSVKLKSSQTSGRYDSLIQSYADSYRSVALSGAQVQSVSTTSLIVSSDSKGLNSSVNDVNNSSSTALVVAASIVILLMMSMAVFFFCNDRLQSCKEVITKGFSPSYQQVQLESDSIHYKAMPPDSSLSTEGDYKGVEMTQINPMIQPVDTSTAKIDEKEVV